MVYELIIDDIDDPLLCLNRNLKYYKKEKGNPNHCDIATIIGTTQRVYGYFKEVDMDFKTALKLNICIPENEKTPPWT
jgi:hypothetical protein